jgi:hypothetical protein
LYGKELVHAAIRAEYPINAEVGAFFEQRAKNFGIDIDIISDTFFQTYDVRTSGSSVLFGGGKDSRSYWGRCES